MQKMTTEQDLRYRKWANLKPVEQPKLALRSKGIVPYDPNAWDWGWNPPGLHYGPIPVIHVLVAIIWAYLHFK